MLDEKRALSLLGLCRKAARVSFGHDAAKKALRSKNAKLCLLCADASARLKEEFRGLAEETGVPLRELPFPTAQLKRATQYSAAVLTIDEVGFAAKLKQTIDQKP
ncbi:MAG: ribosomal L7Ae/L30e/S12e/Gadd45 family protein [Oscillospiraceae bacterium]|jgi:ribosomal protein L7Ae-like RNA K-turn-binding protein|nr:ribosomal L7Ae/L30e/S12e/Gadd45 family protein [Oscillospiraceae bacterium]